MWWAWISCWMRSAGGLTSREEYSTAGFEVDFSAGLVADEDCDTEGRRVRSTDYTSIVSFMLLRALIQHTAKIHHPLSNS